MNNTKVSLLAPCSCDKALSFYGKAIIIEDGDYIKLQSYDTIVCVYYKNSHLVSIRGWFSMTTGRHIKSFLEFLGVRVDHLMVKYKCRSFKQLVENRLEFYIEG